MMVDKPEKWISDMASSGADQFTFHLESTDIPDECVRRIKESGMKVGIAIKPGTDVQLLVPFVKDIDMALVMTVEPGKGGQSFMPDMMSKVKFLRENFPLLDIEVDGGVGPSTVRTCAEHGANMIVSGTAIINNKNRREVIESLKNSVVQNLLR